MDRKQELEKKLIEIYISEIFDKFTNSNLDEARGDKEYQLEYLKKQRRKINILEKNIINYENQYPQDLKSLQYSKGGLLYLKGLQKTKSAIYYKIYGGVFDPSYIDEFDEAIKLFDKSIEITEASTTRFAKVAVYEIADKKKMAINELEMILEKYIDDEETYIRARKEKDELEYAK